MLFRDVSFPHFTFHCPGENDFFEDFSIFLFLVSHNPILKIIVNDVSGTCLPPPVCLDNEEYGKRNEADKNHCHFRYMVERSHPELGQKAVT